MLYKPPVKNTHPIHPRGQALEKNGKPLKKQVTQIVKTRMRKMQILWGLFIEIVNTYTSLNVHLRDCILCFICLFVYVVGCGVG